MTDKRLLQEDEVAWVLKLGWVSLEDLKGTATHLEELLGCHGQRVLSGLRVGGEEERKAKAKINHEAVMITTAQVRVYDLLGI